MIEPELNRKQDNIKKIKAIRLQMVCQYRGGESIGSWSALQSTM